LSAQSDLSVRTIPLDPDVMVPALKEWKLKMPAQRLCVSDTDRQAQDYNGIRDGSIDPIMKAARLLTDGEPSGTSGAFRWCINQCGGRELPPKQTIHRHSTISMTFAARASIANGDDRSVRHCPG
jgi:hypothetical protein